MKIGVAIFAYNRLNHLLDLINSINNSYNKSNLEFYIFHDGLKHNSSSIERTRYYEVKSYLNNLDFGEIIYHNENLGLGPSIIYGVNYIFNKFDYCIVLEDDLIISTQFFSFMKHYFKLYEADHKVYHINGFTGNTWMNKLMPSHFFSRYMSSWGWGTWKSRWSNFICEPSILLNRVNKEIGFFNFNYSDAMHFSVHLKEIEIGKTKNWAAMWYAFIYLNNGVCLNSKYSLVSHEGYGEFATNCTTVVNNNLNVKKFLTVKLDNKKNIIYENSINRYFIKESLLKTSKLKNKRLKKLFKHILDFFTF